MFYYYVSDISKPQYTEIQGQRANFPKDRHLDPQVYILWILTSQICVQHASKPQEVILRDFYFLGKFSFFIFLTEHYSPKGTFGEQLFAKNRAQYWKTILPKFQVSECFRTEMEPKTQDTKWKKCIRGR